MIIDIPKETVARKQTQDLVDLDATFSSGLTPIESQGEPVVESLSPDSLTDRLVEGFFTFLTFESLLP